LLVADVDYDTSPLISCQSWWSGRKHGILLRDFSEHGKLGKSSVNSVREKL